MSNANIVYFSGTGGTRLCAQKLADLLTTGGLSTDIFEIRERTEPNLPYADKLILLYPVYFANAPLPVQEFVRKLPASGGQYTAVLSVSAAGEVVPNLACRMRINELLADRGYNVVYENMLVMPANCLKKPHELVAAALLKVLPYKLANIAEDIMQGKVHRTAMELRSYLATQSGRLPQKFSGLFSLLFKCGSNCNCCGKCAAHCPRGNIYLDKGRVKWDSYCAACMNCLYTCPQQAISMRLVHNKFVIDGGYDINRYLAAADSVRLKDLVAIATTYTNRTEGGVKAYLIENLAIKSKGANTMIKKIAIELYNAYTKGEKLAIPSEQLELDEQTAYLIQKEYSALRAGQTGVAGYKAAMTNPAARARFGVDKPLAASLYAHGVLKDKAILKRTDYHNLVLETELVYFADRDITTSIANVGELRSYFSKVAAGIEIASANFADGKPTGNDMLCVNTNSTQVIVGTQQDIAQTDLNKLPIKFYCNGELLGQGTGADALECQWKCLLWLVNKVLELGYVIRKDDIFFTGALGQVLPGNVGEYHADFAELGTLDFSVQ